MAPQGTKKTTLQEKQNDGLYQEPERAFKGGRIIASPSLGEEVVITGMAGRFPNSDDIYQYRDNIKNKVAMVSSDNRRWEPTHPEIPHRSGKIGFIEKLDAGFFGVHHRQAGAMDPVCRQMLERMLEAVLDAGYHPEELRGSNTGVFIGACNSDTEKTWLYENLHSPTFAVTGCARSMIAQRISYFMGLQGPSYTMDTGSSSSLYAVEHAYRFIRTGRCDNAIVGGVNLCLHPNLTLQFARLGVLNTDGVCRSFDDDASGYVRAETVCALFLQKTKDARRIYAQIVHTKTNCDGFKEEGITFPSSIMQQRLFEELYQECRIDPTTLDFLEAHASATKVGDLEEITAVDEVFCRNRKTPLYVGSVKSHIGHSEPASGLCSIIKVLLGTENDCILPNVNYVRPKEGAEALKQGRMVVVTETTPWPKKGTGLTAVNNFGFGGANCHVILKRFMKRKTKDNKSNDEFPSLFCVSGRTEDSIKSILDDVSERPFHAEFIRLLHEIFRNDIPGHLYRGYMLKSKTGELNRSIRFFGGEKQPLCLVFCNSHTKWLNVGSQLLTIPLFTATIWKATSILSPKGINIVEMLHTENTDVSNVIIGSFVVQAALVDILNTLELSPDYIVGSSTGQVAAAYADGALTLEQALLIVYYIGQSLLELGVDNSKIKSILRADLNIVACNSEKGYTISESQVVNNHLQSEGVLVEGIQNDIELHAKHFAQIRPKLLQYLKEIIPKPKQRSAKWITASISKGKLELPSVYASAEYFVNHLENSILFNTVTSKIPPQSVLLEIGSELLNVKHFNVLNLMSSTSNSMTHTQSLLSGLGLIYELGYNLKLDKLYPKVQWPVSFGTPMISPLIKWNHSKDWLVVKYETQKQISSGELVYSFVVKETNWAFLAGHVIDGQNLFPVTGYLTLVWETFSQMMGCLMSDMGIVFENVKFHRATSISKNGPVTLIVTIQKETGRFEVGEIRQIVVSGRIYTSQDLSPEVAHLAIPVGETDSIQLSTKDIYKELRLRGYNYMGAFRGLKECDVSASTGVIEWTGNWISFMDNMLQLKLLQEDTRNLYVCTSIERLAVDSKAHVRYAKSFGEDPLLPVYSYKETGIIKSGGIEIRGAFANSIPRRKGNDDPVLETYKFVPLETSLSIEQSIRVHIQILLENNYGIKVRVVEFVDEATTEGSTPLGPIMHQVFSDHPLIQSEIVVLSKDSLKLNNVSVEYKKSNSENHSCSLVVVSNIFSRPEIKDQALNALKDKGFIISRENLDFDLGIAEKHLPELKVLSVHRLENEQHVLLSKTIEYNASIVIDISNRFNFDWLPILQESMKSDKKVIVIAQNAPLNGIIGFVTCLRREPGGLNVKCVFIVDEEAPKFNVDEEFYSKQLKKGLTFNVFKDGKWGTYRHLLLAERSVECEHVFNNVTVRGHLSSLRWIEGTLTSKTVLPPEKELIYIYYSSLNFRDIMTASGRINNDVITRDRLEQYNVQGFEFSGRDSTGRRVIGMGTNGALASMVNADSYLIWDVPDNLSMEDAATIPVAYGTVLYGLVMTADIKPHQSILIHAGSGGVGQAAINVALYYKCEIFTTVGSQEKRDFVRQTFPQIPESHIGNSRDISFEQMIFKETNGRGVDIVLNSLCEEKLLASVRCLAPGGKFVEIGKFDMVSNNVVGLGGFTQGRSFHGVTLDAFYVGSPALKHLLSNLLTEGLRIGYVKPLSRLIFKDDEVEQAFQYMAGGKHIGKVMIKLRDEEPERGVEPTVKLFRGIPRVYANPDKCYIIVGGLGGFGLELADWLVTRGAKKLLLVSRSGVKTGYQASRIRNWNSYGVTTKVSNADVTLKEGCVTLINEANELGPVEGIFNLAVVLKDALIENQNVETFTTSLAPKALATQNLDAVSREMCSELLYFVVFSSMSCGRGIVGQTNYGMSNSIMERICEQRKKDGYPALAIQWGAIGEVGLVADMQELQTEIEIGGTLQQRITSCLDVMDTFMKQEEPIVASMVVAEKKEGANKADNIIDAVMNIMGMRDLKTISLHSPLSELGMDSMTAVEIKQTLDTEYKVSLTAQEIRSLTFAKLQDIANENVSESDNRKGTDERLPQALHMLLRSIGDEEKTDTPVIRLTSLIKENSTAPKAFLLSGIEGMASILEPLAANLACHALCLQFTYSDRPEATIEDLAKSLLPRMQEDLPKSVPFTIVAYSYGGIVAMVLAALLEADDRIGRVILIDSSPAMLKEVIKQNVPDVDSRPVLETVVLCTLLQLHMPMKTVMQHKNNIFNCNTFEDRIDLAIKLASSVIPYSEKYQRQVYMVLCLRIKSILIYRPSFRKLKSKITLFKPTKPIMEHYDEDYKIQELCEDKVEINTFDGNHLTILKNPEVGYSINKIMNQSSIVFKQSLS